MSISISLYVVTNLCSSFFLIVNISFAYKIAGEIDVLKKLARSVLFSFLLSASLIVINPDFMLSKISAFIYRTYLSSVQSSK